MSSSNAFIRDPASHPSQSFVKAFSDNQSPADADAPNADIAAVPGHMNENADPTPFVPVDANRAIEEGYATIQVKSQELMNRMGAGMPDRNKGAEEGYVEVQDMLGDSGAFRETVPVKTMGAFGLASTGGANGTVLSPDERDSNLAEFREDAPQN